MATQSKTPVKKDKADPKAAKAAPAKDPKVKAPAKAAAPVAEVKKQAKAKPEKKAAAPEEDLGPVVKVVKQPKAVSVTPKKKAAPDISTANKNMVEARKTITKAFEGAMIDFSKPMKGKA